MRNASILLAFTVCYYRNNTPEIHRKTIQHSFHSLEKSFFIYKRKATSVSSLFSILPQSPGLLFLQSSSTIPFRWNNSLQTKVLRSHVYLVVYNMSFQWGFFQSWHRLRKVCTKLKESRSKGVVSRGFNCCYHAPFTMINSVIF